MTRPIVDHPRLVELRWQLSRLVDLHPELQTAARSVERPLTHLVALHLLAGPTLAGDPASAEAFRLTLSSISEYELAWDAADELLSGLEPEVPFPDPLGLVDPGVLMGVGLAAVFVGALVHRSSDFLAILLGLAVAAGPAEALARLEGGEAGLGAARVALESLGPEWPVEPAAPRLRRGTIRHLLTDPAERSRWAALVEVFGWLERIARDEVSPGWAGVETGLGIRGLVPERPRPGTEVRLEGDFELGGDKVRAVFRSGGAGVLRAVRPVRDEQGAVVALRVRVPKNARPGWVGLTRPARVAAVNSAREALRSALAADTPPWLRHVRPVPEDALPEWTRRSLAPWPTTRRFDGGLPHLISVEGPAEPVEAGAPTRLRWRATGADHVDIDGVTAAVVGEITLTAPETSGPWEATVVPWRSDGGARLDGAQRTLTIQVVQPPAPPPPPPAVPPSWPTRLFAGQPLSLPIELGDAYEGYTLTLASSLGPIHSVPVSGGLAVLPLSSLSSMHSLVPLHAALLTPDGTVALSWALAPIEVVEARPTRLVLVRPATGEQAPGPWSLADRVTVVTLPWVDDALATSGGLLEPEDVPALLDALARQALRSPGLEDAVWLYLAPGGKRPVLEVMPAEAARLLVVATDHPELLQRLADVVLGEDSRPLGREGLRALATPRMRLVGRLDDDGALHLEATGVEVRGAGSGGVSTGLVAVALGRDSRVLSMRTLTSTRQAGARTVGALLAVPDEAVAVEVRQGSEVLRRIHRPLRPPLVDVGELAWTPGAPVAHLPVVIRGATTVTRVDVGVGRAWVELACPTLHDGGVDVPLGRVAPGARLRVRVSDGWTQRTTPLKVPGPARPALAVRPLTDAAWVAVQAEAWVRATWQDGAEPPASTFEPGPGVSSVTARVGSAVDRRVLGPDACAPGAERLGVVVFAPLVGAAPGVPRAEVERQLEAAADGVRFVPWWLPATADLLAVVPGPIVGAGDQVIDGLLVELATMAARTPGLEGSLWLAVVPGDDADGTPARVFAHTAAGAATTVAVATEAAVPDVLEAFLAQRLERRAQPAASTLRLVGALGSDGRLELHEVRREVRRRVAADGPSTALDVVLLDELGVEVSRQPLVLLRSGASRVASLLELPPGVVVLQVEDREQALVVQRVRAPAHAPALRDVQATDTSLSWRVSHPDHLHANVWLEVRVAPPAAFPSSEPVWLPVDCVPAEGPVGVHVAGRVPGWSAARLAASDGWTATTASVPGLVGPPTGWAIRTISGMGFVLVRAGAGDPEVVEAQWTLDGTTDTQVLFPPMAGEGPLEARTDDVLRDTTDPQGRPVCAALGPQLAVVMLRPAVWPDGTPVPDSAVEAALFSAERDHGVRLYPRLSLPWVEDSLAILPSAPTSADDPLVSLLLEHLAVRAARSPGGEDAVWMVVVPAVRGEDWFRIAPAEAAGLLAVGTPGSLPALVGQARPWLDLAALQEASQPVLRVIGHLPRQGPPELLDVRQEERRLGGTSTEGTDLSVVLLDDDGREVVVRSIRTVHAQRPARFTLLLPVHGGVRHLVVRNHVAQYAQQVRVAAAPEFLEPPRVHRGRLEWQHVHRYRGTHPVEVDVAVDGIWTPALRQPDGATEARLPAARLPAGSDVRVTLTDGWNERAEPATGRLPALSGARAVIRQLGDGRLWLDTGGSDATVHWDLHGVTPPPADLFPSSPDVRLSARSGGSVSAFVLQDGDRPVHAAALPTGELPDSLGAQAEALSGGWAVAAAWHRTGGLAIARSDHRIVVARGDQATELGHHAAAVTALAVDGRRVVSGAEDGTATMWPLDGGAPVPLVGHRDAVRSVVLGRPDDPVLTGSRDGSARLFAPDGALVAELGHQAPIVWVGLAREGAARWVVSVSADGEVRVWDLQGRPRFASHQGWGPSRVVHRAEAAVRTATLMAGRVAVGTEDGRVLVWPLDRQADPVVALEGAAPITHLWGSGRAQRMLSADEAGEVRDHTLSSGEWTQVDDHDEDVLALGYLDGHRPAVVYADGRLEVGEARARTVALPLRAVAALVVDSAVILLQGARMDRVRLGRSDDRLPA